MRQERYAGNDREVVDAWIDRVTFAAIGIIGLLSSGLLLLAAAVVGKSDDDFQSTLQVFGFLGIIVTSVIQMRVVAQLLRRETDASGQRRV
jgi:ubiquinone biosynthesis protein